MRTLLTAAFFWAALLSPVYAGTPWVASGQTTIAAGAGIDNPVTANSGAVGQVLALPYVVPIGSRLCITAYGMEGYNAAGIAVLFVWTGDPPVVTPQWRIDHGLPSVAAKDGSSELTGLNFCFDEGETINIRLINGQNITAVFGWYVTGELTNN